MVLSVGGDLGDNDGNDFLLEGNIVAEDVDRILVHIAKLVGLSLAQQQLDSITLAQVFLDHESLNFLFRLWQPDNAWVFEIKDVLVGGLTIWGRWNSSFSEMSSALRLDRGIFAATDCSTIKLTTYTIKLLINQIYSKIV